MLAQRISQSKAGESHISIQKGGYIGDKIKSVLAAGRYIQYIIKDEGCYTTFYATDSLFKEIQ